MQSILSSVPKTIYIKYCIKFNFSPQEKSENRIFKGNSFLCVNFGSRYWCTMERSCTSPLVKCGRITTSSFEALKILHKTISFPEIDVCFKVV